ncbi:glutathione peroxidase [Agrococcus jejuensis]|uniref:Glutathione peroxidase n=1 Tax=Agrococcus jejuensis TaxID=399736 RepID=A0A1G8G401_9MICO|nr:glutathione peroxidase [Agrococcus jejuensis]SDH89099.1 glutathione peroxidase [Agrococcus jejuensis]
MTTIADFSMTRNDGTEQPLAELEGKVVVVVNTASSCGFTPQYEGLEQLYKQYGEQGLVVLGFPSDQFKQETGDDAAIAEFCQVNYGVTFPLSKKVAVNGKDAHPLFQWLRKEKGGILGDAIKWNFTKFLVGRDGAVVKRYAPTVEPKDMAADVERALAA